MGQTYCFVCTTLVQYIGEILVNGDELGYNYIFLSHIAAELRLMIK